MDEYFSIVNEAEQLAIKGLKNICDYIKFRINWDKRTGICDNPKHLYDSELEYLCQEFYSKKIPISFFFTPNVIMTFPVKAEIKTHWSSYDSWNESSNFSIEKCSIPEKNESPFGLFFKTNSNSFDTCEMGDIENIRSHFVKPYTNFLDKINDNLGEISPFIQGLNNVFSKEFPYPKLKIIK